MWSIYAYSSIFLLNYDIQTHLNQFSHYMHQPNFIILMTDQQRSLQHFPEDWVRENLPNYSFFLDNSVKFTNHICNTSPCGPCRASLFSGMKWSRLVGQSSFLYVVRERMFLDGIIQKKNFCIIRSAQNWLKYSSNRKTCNVKSRLKKNLYTLNISFAIIFSTNKKSLIKTKTRSKTYYYLLSLIPSLIIL